MSSPSRVLTTHTGSLPRPAALKETMERSVLGRPNAEDQRELPRLVADGVAQIVRQQAEVGLDVVSDGEASKPSYSTYVTQRLSGFDGVGPIPGSPEAHDFPEWAASLAVDVTTIVAPAACTGDVAYVDRTGVETDIANLTAALEGVPHEDAFMTAASPGVISLFLENQHYPSHEAYIGALADAMKTEYDAIHAAGFLLQIDCPDLAAGRWSTAATFAMTMEAWLAQARLHVEALNAATRDIPPERMRMHICWGNSEGPHTRDVPLEEIIDVVLAARPAALLFEAANPRHEHEWRVFEDVRVPDGKLLVPGVLDSTTNYVEHPRLVAERLVRLARLVGRENVMAGTDCGFASFVGHLVVHPEVTWAKLAAMVEGAELATRELWHLGS